MNTIVTRLFRAAIVDAAAGNDRHVSVISDEKIVVNNNQIGEMTQKIYDELTGIQWGLKEDTFGWTVKVD